MEGQHIVWQSFDYPTDTLLPGMKVRWDLRNKLSIPVLNSWVGPNDHIGGAYSVGILRNNLTTLMVWHGTDMKNIGYVDNKSSKFVLWSSSNRYNFTYISNASDLYLEFNTAGNKMSWWVLTSTGVIDEFTMVDQKIVSLNHSLCEYGNGENSTGCLITMRSICGIQYTFVETRGKMQNASVVSRSIRMGLSDCEKLCRQKCLCKAYALVQSDVAVCEIYYGDKKGFLDITEQANQMIFIREDTLTDSENSSPDEYCRKIRLILWIILPFVFSSFFFLIVTIFRLWRKKRGKIKLIDNEAIQKSLSIVLYQFGSYAAGTNTDGFELPALMFSCLDMATNKFASEQKVGEGGFGPVFKGVLLGHEIAVKRFSGASGQGLKEFKSEVQLISKLQHTNLVRLLGYCAEREEKILIYEYLPNKSLDLFIFNEAREELLNWRKRIQIIEGIAQGILYLHKFSRLKIIHRDLKSSNILLDAQMNPKISDFGLARIFQEDKSVVKTRKVAGTFGYMSPEYATHGLFSTKSDVFSFGVIMLEIISGQRNTNFSEPNQCLTLLGYAWMLWKEGQLMDFIDPTLSKTYRLDELILCVQIALLCVQEKPGDRPSMLDVASMLNKEKTTFPKPKQPAFSSHLYTVDADLSIDEQKI